MTILEQAQKDLSEEKKAKQLYQIKLRLNWIKQQNKNIDDSKEKIRKFEEEIKSIEIEPLEDILVCGTTTTSSLFYSNQA